MPTCQFIVPKRVKIRIAMALLVGGGVVAEPDATTSALAFQTFVILSTCIDNSGLASWSSFFDVFRYNIQLPSFPSSYRAAGSGSDARVVVTLRLFPQSRCPHERQCSATSYC